MNLDKNSIKIFLTFFIIYSYFSVWTSWDEEVFFALTKAIVEESRIEIDSFHNVTFTKFWYNGSYYIDFPRQSLFLTPIYSLFRNTLFTKIHDLTALKYYSQGEALIYNVEPPPFIFIATIFTSSLFMALNVMLFYKISRYFTQKNMYRVIATFAYGLGTPTFQASLVFLSIGQATFFSFLAFSILFITKVKKINKNRYFLISGLICGIAALLNPLANLLVLCYIFYIFSFQKKKIPLFLLGYIVAVFSSFFIDFYYYPSIFDINFFNQTINNFKYPLVQNQLHLSGHWAIPLQLIASPYRGLLFYSPIVILSPLGLFHMYRRYKIETLLIILISTVVILSLTYFSNWWGGFTFGPKYLTLIMPFLGLSVLYAFDLVDRKICFLLIIISIFISMLSLQYWEGNLSIMKPEEYLNRMNSLQALGNPILDRYLPLFFVNGPRSILLENLLMEGKLDIRNTHTSCGLTPEVLKKTELPLFSLPSLGIVTLKIPFLSLVPITIILFLIWLKDIQKKIKLSLNEWTLIFFFLILCFIIFFIGITDSVYGENWYAPEWYDGKTDIGSWISQNATLILFNKHNISEKIRLMFDIETFNKTRNLVLYLNNGLVETYKISGKVSISQQINLTSGENELKFYSVESCNRPTEVGISECDLRCLSFKVTNIKILKTF